MGEKPEESSQEEIVEGVPLTEKENLQYEALQKVESFDELYEYIDAYSTPNYGGDNVVHYHVLDSKPDHYISQQGKTIATGYDYGKIRTRAENIKSGIANNIIKYPRYREETMLQLPGEIRARVKYLLEKEENQKQ